MNFDQNLEFDSILRLINFEYRYCERYSALKSDKISFDYEIKLSEKNSDQLFEKLDKRDKQIRKKEYYLPFNLMNLRLDKL